MKEKENKTRFAAAPVGQRFSGLKKIVLVFLLTLGGANLFAQDVCPDSGWENEPIQQEGSCCALFDMLPSTPDFPWAYWFVVADEVTYSSSDYATGEFKACFGEGGMHNVVVTYVDAMGVTLCENDWTVFIDDAECIDPCEDCVEFTGIEMTTADDCTFNFEMDYSVDLGCEGLEITSLTWDFGYPGGTGTGATVSHTFPESDAYTVTATIEYTFGDEMCTKTQSLTAWAFGCVDVGDGVDCLPYLFIESDNHSMTIGLPTKDPCESPTYGLTIREFGTEDEFIPATFTTTEVSPGVYEATITGLEPCMSYEVVAELFCEGESAGICTHGEAWSTNCPPPCSGCLELHNIEVIRAEDCDYSFELDYDLTDECGDIEVVSIDWDFGDGSVGEGESVDASFLCSGPHTITATVSYISSIHPEVVCEKEISKEIEVEDCEEVCTTCYADPCVKVIDLIVEPKGGCLYWFTFDSGLGSCGPFEGGSVYFDWDFGHGTGNVTGSPDFWVPHTFPGNGTYTVTMTYHYQLAGDDTEYSCSIRISVDVTDCDDERGDKRMAQQTGGAIGNSGIHATTVPNPADEQVIITVIDPTNSSDLDQLQLVIYDVNGREVYRGDTRIGSQKMIDVNHLQSGLYIYEVRNGETVLLKEKLLIK